MPTIDEQALEQDLEYRLNYLLKFVSFGSEDITAIEAVAPKLAPLIPSLVDAVYIQLNRYDATWRYLAMHQSGYEGLQVESMEELTLEHPQILYRKKHLTRYLERLLTELERPDFVQYLNTVGKVHTAKAGNPAIQVPLVHMNALLGFINTIMIQTIMGFALDQATKVQAIQAFTKLLWVQNDLVSKHY